MRTCRSAARASGAGAPEWAGPPHRPLRAQENSDAEVEDLVAPLADDPTRVEQDAEARQDDPSDEQGVPLEQEQAAEGAAYDEEGVGQAHPRVVDDLAAQGGLRRF